MNYNRRLFQIYIKFLFIILKTLNVEALKIHMKKLKIKFLIERNKVVRS